MAYQVIIIEDDPMVAAIDRQYVETDSRFQVAHVLKSGGEALGVLEHCRPDLIILDYYTPSMDGMEFVDRLHAMGQYPAIIMVTSANDREIVQGLLSRGVLDYLVKPFAFARFRQAMDKFLQTQNLLSCPQESSLLDQQAIDRLIRRQEHPEPGGNQMSKGLNAATLERVRSFLSASRGQALTSEEIAEQIKALEIGKFKNKRIYLRDVADVKFMSREVRSKAYVNGEPAARFRIIKKGEANAIEVINGIRDRFNAMIRNGELPTGMKLVWFTDSGAFIQASVDDAWSSILTGIILTAVLLFLFLHEPKSTFIVMISMPISVIVTFAVMAYFKYSFNIMTLLSLGCSVGVLVTNSIVVIENIFKHLDKGEPIKAAAERGTGEVIAAVSASALTNVVVFVPVMMMTTRIGSMMVPFAGVMVGATLVSLFISFTLTPILACVLLKRKRKSQEEKLTFLQKVFIPWDRGYDWLCRLFNRSIEWTARYPKTLMLVVLGLAAAVCFLIVPQVGLSFLPFCDQGEIRIKFEFPTNYNLDTTNRLIQEAADHLKNAVQAPTRAKTVVDGHAQRANAYERSGKRAHDHGGHRSQSHAGGKGGRRGKGREEPQDANGTYAQNGDHDRKRTDHDVHQKAQRKDLGAGGHHLAVVDIMLLGGGIDTPGGQACPFVRVPQNGHLAHNGDKPHQSQHHNGLKPTLVARHHAPR